MGPSQPLIGSYFILKILEAKVSKKIENFSLMLRREALSIHAITGILIRDVTHCGRKIVPGC